MSQADYIRGLRDAAKVCETMEREYKRRGANEPNDRLPTNLSMRMAGAGYAADDIQKKILATYEQSLRDAAKWCEKQMRINRADKDEIAATECQLLACEIHGMADQSAKREKTAKRGGKKRATRR